MYYKDRDMYISLKWEQEKKEIQSNEGLGEAMEIEKPDTRWKEIEEKRMMKEKR